jgi:integrase
MTSDQIEALEPRLKPYQVTHLPGLVVEVSPRGVKTFRFRFKAPDGRAGIYSLGNWPQTSLQAAERQHQALKKQLAKEILPKNAVILLKKQEEAKESLRIFAPKYLKDMVLDYGHNARPMERYLEREIYPALGKTPLNKISDEAVRNLIFAIKDRGSKCSARAVRDLLKRIFDYAEARGLITSNPAAKIKPRFIAKIVSRDRALDNREVGVFMRSLDNSKQKKKWKIAFNLILLNLIRKCELQQADWSEFDLSAGLWTIPAEHAKTKHPLLVPISRQTIALLEQLADCEHRVGLVIPQDNSQYGVIADDTLNKVLARIPHGLKHFTIHDLRRTAATLLSEMEYDPEWIEKALNHALKGIRGVYNRAQYARQRKDMLQAWADHIDRLRDLAQ